MKKLIWLGVLILLQGCATTNQSYVIEFQKQDKITAEKPAKRLWMDKEVEVVGDNYVRGKIQGNKADLTKLKELIEAMKFAVELTPRTTEQKGGIQ